MFTSPPLCGCHVAPSWLLVLPTRGDQEYTSAGVMLTTMTTESIEE